MPDFELEGPLTDAALEREIERAVGVDPSPAFVARVRTRISSEPALARGASAAWAFGAGGVMLASAVLAAVLWPAGAGRETDPLAGATGAAAGRDAIAAAPAAAPASVSQDSTRLPAPPARAPAAEILVRRARPSGLASFELAFATPDVEPLQLPDVVLAPDEQRGLALLLTPPARPEPELAALPDPGDIEVVGVIVEPLAQIARLEGELP
jgi:hypothetical protein